MHLVLFNLLKILWSQQNLKNISSKWDTLHFIKTYLMCRQHFDSVTGSQCLYKTACNDYFNYGFMPVFSFMHESADSWKMPCSLMHGGKTTQCSKTEIQKTSVLFKCLYLNKITEDRILKMFHNLQRCFLVFFYWSVNLNLSQLCFSKMIFLYHVTDILQMIC